MIATRRSLSSSPIASTATAAWTGFVHDRTKTSRSGSPTEATSPPAASQTATSPRWIDSSRPERITRTSGAERTAIDRSAQWSARLGSSL